MNKQQIKDLVERALWTFFQAFVVVLGAGLLNVLNAFHNNLSDGKAAAVALIAAAVAAGISAVKTTVVSIRNS